MGLKLLLIAAALGICVPATQGQTTTALPIIPIWEFCKVKSTVICHFTDILWTGGGAVCDGPLSLFSLEVKYLFKH